MIDYQISSTQALFFPVLPVYSSRHFHEISMESTWQGKAVHFVMGAIELPPFLGALISIIERLLLGSKRVIYFSYGSNMSRSRLEKRVGKVKHLGKATLKGYTLRLNKKGQDGTGKANIVPKSQTQTEGVLFELSHRQLLKLDPFEGAPRHYERKRVQLLNDKGERIEAITYIAKQKWTVKKALQPSKEYLNHILQGARENQIKIEFRSC